MKLALRYHHGSIPLSIEVEGEALMPETISKILESILEPLEYWLKTFTRKEGCFSPGESSGESLRQKASHSNPLHPSGFASSSGSKGAEAHQGEAHLGDGEEPL